MSVAALLDRLQGVRAAGPGRWMARCSAHEDARPSLSIRELPDLRILIHCFGGCEVGAVLAAVNLEFKDLYPDLPIGHARAQRTDLHGHAAKDVLQLLARESFLVGLAAETVAAGRALTQEDRHRVALAAGRIRVCAGMVL